MARIVVCLFAQALEKQGQQISALDYWKAVRLDINPDLWLDLVFDSDGFGLSL
jgi:hypothetical protein